MMNLSQESIRVVRDMTITECLQRHYHHFKYGNAYFSIIGISNCGGHRVYDCYDFSANQIVRNVSDKILVTPIERKEAVKAYEAQ